MPDIGAAPIQLSAWFADLGDEVFEGDRLVELLVEGATFDVSAPVSGQLVEQRTRVGEPVTPGQILGAIAGDPVGDAHPA